MAQDNGKDVAVDKNLIANGDFEKGSEGWLALWTRNPGTGKTAFDTREKHSSTQSMRIEHTGDKDWSLSHAEQLNVVPGDIFALSGWVRLQGKGNASLGVITRDADGKVLDWNHGGKSTRETKDRRTSRSWVQQSADSPLVVLDVVAKDGGLEINGMGILTSRYDIFQDTMNPENFPKLRWIHPDWTSEAWAKDDLMIGKDGEWVRGWEVETKDGKMIPCGTLCDRQAVSYARKRITAELAKSPFRCRFIDTTTASPWRECYHPKHPMTRTESKHYKMELLRYVNEGCGLVCGSETGHDAAVPYVHYFEGMLSLGPYRVPDSGREMSRIWNNVPEQVAKFQIGHVYRIPLWELVYHDCVVSHWYWGDYNNKLPKLWDSRDLWNTLYGTSPMFMFNRKSFEADKDRFVKSYNIIAPVARATGYSEMLSHEWVTADHAVQQTRFENGAE